MYSPSGLPAGALEHEVGGLDPEFGWCGAGALP